MAAKAPQAREVAVIESVQEIAPGIIEVDEYVVESEPRTAVEPSAGSEPLGGPEQD
jgi:hypothetical protein